MATVNQLSLGEIARDEGIRRTAADNKEWLTGARREAARVAARRGTVSSVDIRKWADAANYHPFSPAAWGAIFSGPQWEHVGWTQCQHVGGHARDVKVWKYAGAR